VDVAPTNQSHVSWAVVQVRKFIVRDGQGPSESAIDHRRRESSSERVLLAHV